MAQGSHASTAAPDSTSPWKTLLRGLKNLNSFLPAAPTSSQWRQNAEIGDKSSCVRRIQIDRRHATLDHFGGPVMQQIGETVWRVFLSHPDKLRRNVRSFSSISMATAAGLRSENGGAFGHKWIGSSRNCRGCRGG